MSKPIHALVLDAGPLLTSSRSSVEGKADRLYTCPRAVDEIRDEASRRRFEEWKDQITIRKPSKDAMAFVVPFAKLTGDFPVLSVTDVQLLALTYELECELNLGDWRLRRTPGQERINGSVPEALRADSKECQERKEGSEASDESDESDEEVDDDGEGEWITPGGEKSEPEMKEHIKAACATSDFAMQNVLLQIGLNLVSLESGRRITSVKTWVLRCHACFKIVRDTSTTRQFCPSCGGPTLLRASCSVDTKGTFRIHLKRNMQWNNRGTVYPLPKPQHGTASMKGVYNPILSEDQKEYTVAKKKQNRQKQVDLFDPDRLPGILTGQRSDHTRIQIGLKGNPNQVRKCR